MANTLSSGPRKHPLQPPHPEQTEIEVRRSEARYRRILETIEDGYYEMDLEGNVLFANDALARIFGLAKREEIVGLNYRQILEESMADRGQSVFRTVYETGQAIPIYDFVIRDQIGGKRCVTASISPMIEEGPEIIGFRGICRDVTERRRRDEAVRQSEERYRAIIENIQDGYFEVDLSGDLTFGNEAFYRILEISEKEAIGLGYRQYMSEETARRIFDLYHQVYLSGESIKTIDYEIITRKGDSIYVETSISLIKNVEGEAIGFRGIVRDVSKRKHAEQALAESEQRFRAVFDNALDGLVIVDDEMRYLDANPAALRNLGMTRHELLQHRAIDFVRPEKLGGFENFIQRLRKDGRATGAFVRKVNGQDVTLEYNIAANFIPGQHITVMRDVTAREEASRAVAENERRFRAVFDNALDAMVMINDELKFVDVNQAACEMVGLTKEQFTQRELKDFLAPGSEQASLEAVESLGREGALRTTQAVMHPDRSIHITEFNAKANVLPGLHLSVNRDITEKVRSAKLISAQVEVLEMISTGERLDAIMDRIVRLVEDVSGDALAAIRLFDRANNRLDSIAAPSLASELRLMMSAWPVELGMGTCAAAALTQQTVLAEDIAASPHWLQVKDAALSFGLKSSWSAPIQTLGNSNVQEGDESVSEGPGDRLGGTICLFYRETRRPSHSDMELIAVASNLASIAIERVRAEEKLRATGSRFRAMIEKSADGIILINHRSEITYTSPAFSRILGYKPEDLSETSGEKKVHSLDRADVLRRLTDLLHFPGSSERSEFRIQHKDGRWLWLEATGRNLLHDGDIRAVVINFRDISARKYAEEELRVSEKRFVQAFNATPDPMTISTLEEGRVVLINQSWLDTIGLKREQVIGKTTAELDIWKHPLPRKRFVKWISQQGKLRDLEFTTQLKNGEQRTQLISMETLEINGKMHLLTVSRDITERKQNEDKLKASEERFFKAFKASPIPVSISTLQEGRFVNVNDAWLKTMGFSKEEVIGKTSTEINFVIPQVSRQALIDRVRKESGVPHWEFDLRLRNGERRTFLGAVEIIKLDGNEYFLVASQDITQRKLMENKLRASEERFSKAFNSSPLPFAISTFDEGIMIDVNQAWLEGAGYTREEIIGKTEEEIRLYYGKTKRREAIERLRRDGHIRDWEVLHRLKSGEIRTFLVSMDVIRLDEEDYILTSSKDITETKRAEERLRRSEERYRALYEKNLAGVYKTSLDGLMLEGNASLARIFGFESFNEMRSEAEWSSYIHPQDRIRLIDKLRNQGRLNNYEMQQKRRDGTHIWTLSNITLIPGEDDDAGMLEGVVLDITDLKLAEAELRESRERYKTLFDHSFVGICRTTVDGKILECNDSLAEMFGYQSPEEMKSVNTWDLYLSQDVRGEMLNDALADNRYKNLERLMRRKDGTLVWTLSNGTFFENGVYGEPVLEGVFLDITGRKKTEDDLKQHREQLRALSAKIESVREEERKSIAREIHDQLGQLMTGLKLEFAWVEKRILLTDDEALRERLAPKMSEIDDLLETTIHTVRDIASKLRPGHLDDLGLIAAIKWEAQGFSKRSGVRTDLSLCREPENFTLDRATGLFRILQEILTNVARHAQASEIRITLSNEDGEIVLIVEDDGIGIAPEKLTNTKSLGLMGMRERALLLQGEVAIEPLPKQGTRVTVTIPAEI